MADRILAVLFQTVGNSGKMQIIALSTDRSGRGFLCVAPPLSATAVVFISVCPFLQLVFRSFLLGSAHGILPVPWNLLFFALYLGKTREKRHSFACKSTIYFRFLTQLINTPGHTWIPLYTDVCSWFSSLKSPAVSEPVKPVSVPFCSQMSGNAPAFTLPLNCLSLYLTEMESMYTFSIHPIWSRVAFLLASPQTAPWAVW